MATFIEIQNRVTRRLIDTNASITTEVPGLVNRALRIIQELHNFKIMEEQVEYTTTFETRLLNAQPTDWKESRLSPYIRQWDGASTPIQWLPSIQEAVKRYAIDDTNDKAMPEHVLWDGDSSSFHIYPFPDNQSNFTGGDWRVNIPYWKYLPELSADGDTNWFTLNADWWLTFLAVAEGFWLNWDEERAQFWEARAGLEFAKMKKINKSAMMTRQSRTLTPRFSVRGYYREGR